MYGLLAFSKSPLCEASLPGFWRFAQFCHHGSCSRICDLSAASTVLLTFVRSTVQRLHSVQASTVHISGVPGL